MELLDLPFIQISPADIPRPLIPVTIKNPHTGKCINLYGLVDTGADECAIPASYALLLGHDLQAGYPKVITTGNGQTNSYSHTMCIKSGDVEINDVLIDFLPNLNMLLLGAKNFLSNFILTIDYKNQVFSLKKPE